MPILINNKTLVGPISDITPEKIGASPTTHNHDSNYATTSHTHTPSSIGAAEAVHTHTINTLGGAPLPKIGSGVGEWVQLIRSNREIISGDWYYSFYLPSGGTWAYYVYGDITAYAGYGNNCGIAAGGTNVCKMPGSDLSCLINGFAWRIS